MELGQQRTQTIARMMLGSGMAGKAADAMKFRPIWQQQIVNQETDLPFEEWLRQYQQPQTIGTMVQAD